MAKDKKTEPKMILERTYIVPLRSEWLKVPRSYRAKKAVKALKQFMVQHMKIYDRDIRKIKVDIMVNNEIRFRGMKKPLHKIKVIAKKYDNDIVRVSLAEIPSHVSFEKAKLDRRKAKVTEKIKEKKVEEPKVPEKTEEQKKDTIEKEAASKEENLEIAKEDARELKHSKDKKVVMPRKTLSR